MTLSTIIRSLFVSEKGFQVNSNLIGKWESRIESKPHLCQMKLTGRNPYEAHMVDVWAKSAGLCLEWNGAVDTNILDQLTD